jgi:TniQ
MAPANPPVEASQLRVRSAFAPDESILGYRLRLAEANGYPRLHCVAAPLRPHPETAGAERPGEGGRGGMTFVGGSVSVTLFNVDRRHAKICPSCLRSRLLIPFAWDLTLWVVCPLHGCRLAWECKRCSRNIDWRREHLDRCCADHPFAGFDADPAPPASVDLAKCLAGRLGVVAPAEPPLLRGLTSGLGGRDLCSLIWLLGRLDRPWMKPGGARVTPWEASEVFDKAASLLAGWPESFHDAIAAVANPRLTVSEVDLKNLLGRTYFRMVRARGVLQFVHEELMKGIGTLSQRFRLLRGGKDREGKGAFILLREAAMGEGVSYVTAKRLASRGLVDTEKLRTGGSRRHLFVDAELFRSLVAERNLDTRYRVASALHGTVSHRKAAKELGTSTETFAKLRAHGILDQTVQIGSTRYATQRGLDILLARLAALPAAAQARAASRADARRLKTVAALAATLRAPFERVLSTILEHGISVRAVLIKKPGLARYLFDPAEIRPFLRRATDKLPHRR